MLQQVHSYNRVEHLAESLLSTVHTNAIKRNKYVRRKYTPEFYFKVFKMSTSDVMKECLSGFSRPGEYFLPS